MKDNFWLFFGVFLFVLGGILLAPFMYVLAYYFWLYTDMVFDLYHISDYFERTYFLVMFLGSLIYIFKRFELAERKK